ncbi:MAG TPA: PIG-L family deacetylase [Methylomirabilota bacterium]
MRSALVLGASMLLAAGGMTACRRTSSTVGRRLHTFPQLGTRVFVLAPHPDDEVLGAAGLIDAVRRRGLDMHVVVATDGAAGPDKLGLGKGLAREREAETRRALAALGVPLASVSFLGVPDGHLTRLWERGWGPDTSGERESADDVLGALDAAFVAGTPDAVVLPMPLDAHPDHRALHHFAVLALLGARPEVRPPEVLGYLIHGSRSWERRPVDLGAAEPPVEGCAGALFPWTGLLLDPAEVARKASLIQEYRTQTGHSTRLLRYARRTESFARGQIIVGPRAMSSTRPGLAATRDGIVIRIPRARCGIDPAAGDGLRLRFPRPDGIDERLVRLHTGGAPIVLGGRAGHPTELATDVRVAVSGDSVRLQLAAETVAGAPGAFLEVLPARGSDVGPAWGLRWAGMRGAAAVGGAAPDGS